jgi:predicted amidohydrolase
VFSYLPEISIYFPISTYCQMARLLQTIDGPQVFLCPAAIMATRKDGCHWEVRQQALEQSVWVAGAGGICHRSNARNAMQIAGAVRRAFVSL